MEPLMTKWETRCIEEALLDAAKRNGSVRVLEWGSGGSTVYFTRFLRERGIPYTWRSVEYNQRWFTAISGAIQGDPHTTIALLDVGNDELKQRDIEMNEYVQYPTTLGECFDVVIVDGRKRRRCVLEAQQILAPQGVVFLHDAQRAYYQSAFTAYPDQTLLGVRLWRGRNEKPGFLQKIVNSIRSLYFKTVNRVWSQPSKFTRGKYQLTVDALQQGMTMATQGKLLLITLLFILKKRKLFTAPISFSLLLRPSKEPVRISTGQYTTFKEFYDAVVSRARVS